MQRYLREIVLRSYYITFSVIITSLCSYFFPEQTIYPLAIPSEQAHYHRAPTGESLAAIFEPRPYGIPLGRRWIATELTEAFWTYARVSMSVTIYMFFPTILCQVWLFIKPGLYSHEKKSFANALALSFCLSQLSFLFTYFVVLPEACKFFLSFEIASIRLHLEAKIYAHIGLTLRLLFWSQFIFQLPTIALICAKLGGDILVINWFLEVKAKKTIRYFFITLASWIIYPYDIFGQVIVLFSIIILYESAVFTATFTRLRKRCKHNILYRSSHNWQHT